MPGIRTPQRLTLGPAALHTEPTDMPAMAPRGQCRERGEERGERGDRQADKEDVHNSIFHKSREARATHVFMHND